MTESTSRRNYLSWAYWFTSPSYPFAEGAYAQSKPNDFDHRESLYDSTLFTPLYLTTRIESVEWYPTAMSQLELEYGRRFPAYASQSVAGFRKKALLDGSGFHYQGHIEQSRFRIVASRVDHEPVKINCIKVKQATGFWGEGIGADPETISAEAFTVELPKGKLVTPWQEIKAPIGDGQDITLKLLPVDLDIIHPATGELADAKEDLDDGGYVSVQRLEDPADSTSDVTPKTKLKIHAVAIAQSAWKIRLKFNGADRYKIYRDEARTQEVVSEQTEFDATQDTTLYFHGLKKSVSRGGELVTMQVKVNDIWLDGDSVKCTILQSEFLIQVKAFIPYGWTEAEEEVPLFNEWSPMAGKVAKGDLHPGLGDRPASPGFLNVYSTDKVLPPGPVAPGTSTEGLFRNAPFRCCQTIILTPYKELHSSYDLQLKRKHMTAPSSDHYVKATSVNAAELALKKGYMGLSGGTSATGKGPITTIDYRNGFRAGKMADLSVEFGGKDGALGTLLGVPFSWGAADIHWKLSLRINAESNPLLPWISFNGNHDRYPAYEIIVIQSDGTYKPIHNVLPAASALPGPVSLKNGNAISVGRLDTIRD